MERTLNLHLYKHTVEPHALIGFRETLDFFLFFH